MKTFQKKFGRLLSTDKNNSNANSDLKNVASFLLKVTASVVVGYFVGKTIRDSLNSTAKIKQSNEPLTIEDISIQGEITERVYFDVSIDGASPDRIVIGLYGKDCPVTVKNFVAIAKGDHISKTNGTRLHYLNSKFHRIIPSFMIQGK
jgi:hypothetical protein